MILSFGISMRLFLSGALRSGGGSGIAGRNGRRVCARGRLRGSPSRAVSDQFLQPVSVLEREGRGASGAREDGEPGRSLAGGPARAAPRFLAGATKRAGYAIDGLPRG